MKQATLGMSMLEVLATTAITGIIIAITSSLMPGIVNANQRNNEIQSNTMLARAAMESAQAAITGGRVNLTSPDISQLPDIPATDGKTRCQYSDLKVSRYLYAAGAPSTQPGSLRVTMRCTESTKDGKERQTDYSVDVAVSP